MRIHAVRLGLLAVGVLLSGCQSVMDLVRGGAPGPKPAELPTLTNPAPVRVLWTASAGRADRYIFAPAVVGDAVYAAGSEGTVTRLDAASGASRWRVNVERRL